MSEPSWDVLGILEHSTAYLEEHGVESPRLSAELLIASVFGVKRLDVYMMFDRPVGNRERLLLKEKLRRRAKHEPIQYILGTCSFFDLELEVNSSVLIPRPETEELVSLVLEQERSHQQEKLYILDVGTGSGCIPLALKAKCKSWILLGLDIAEDALATARLNAKRLDLEVTFFRFNMLKKSFKKPEHPLDILVSNPPYIPLVEKNNIDKQVRDFEPEVALFCEDPLIFYKALSNLAQVWLKPGARIYLELHEDFAQEVQILFATHFIQVKLIKDLSEKLRFLTAVK